MMDTVSLIQGSPEWLTYRRSKRNASDAPAMLGESPYTSRTALIKQYAAGIVEEIDNATQQVMNRGHLFEALARPMAEMLIGEELYPVTGFVGDLSASFDGITMLGDVIWEHKTLNAGIRKATSAAELPANYRIQMEQQLLVSGAEKCLFMASTWDLAAKAPTEYVYHWYTPDLELRQRIVKGWKQFADDVASYAPQPEYIPAQPQPVAALPTLVIKVDGALVINGNLDRFGDELRRFIDNTNIKPTTDQDFADLEQAWKILEDAEAALDQAESNAIAQTVSVADMCRTIGELKSLARHNRLLFKKLVTVEKENRKQAIVFEAKAVFAVYAEELEAGLPVKLTVYPDFSAAIKGKKSIKSMQEAVADMLASAKIEATSLANDIKQKLAFFETEAAEHRFLFNDMHDLITKPLEHFGLIITSRIEQHQAAEAQRLARIEAEAKAKAEAEAAKLLERERQRMEAEARLKAETEAKAKAEALPRPAPVAPTPETTPEQLRATAARMREGAERADRNADRQRELAEAAAVSKKADALAAQLAAQAFGYSLQITDQATGEIINQTGFLDADTLAALMALLTTQPQQLAA
jgi:putative phage-type endonuclease